MDKRHTKASIRTSWHFFPGSPTHHLAPQPQQRSRVLTDNSYHSSLPAPPPPMSSQ